MSLGGRFQLAVAGACLLSVASGCDLSGLTKNIEKNINDKIADFKNAIPQGAAGVDHASANLGNSGGQVVAQNGAVNVPEGALTGDTQVSVAQVQPQALMAPLSGLLKAVAPPMAFTPHGTTFAMPVTLSLFFTQPATQDMAVVRLDNEQDTSWELVMDTKLDGQAAYVSTTHFSIYGVVSCIGTNAEQTALCGKLASGEASLDDLTELVPPGETGAFDGVGQTMGGDTNPPGGDEKPPPDMPPDTHVDCSLVPQCTQLLQSCNQHPQDQLCAHVPECKQLLVQCHAVPPPPAGADAGVPSACDQVAQACRAGNPQACALYKEECSGGPIDPGTDAGTADIDGGVAQPSFCDQAWIDCQNGDQSACDTFQLECANEPPPPPPCDQMAMDCKSGDQNACMAYEAECVGGGADAGAQMDECTQLAMACDGGDPASCDKFQAACQPPPDGDGGMPPPPPPPPNECQKFADGCFMFDDPGSCDMYYQYCAP
jgi:hypothetical protein